MIESIRVRCRHCGRYTRSVRLFKIGQQKPKFRLKVVDGRGCSCG